MTTDSTSSPSGEDEPPLALHLPFAALEDLRFSSASGPPMPILAHGQFVLQALGGESRVALAGPLSVEPLAKLWPDPRRMARSADGVLLLHLTSNAAVDADANEDWLLHHAPAWRLATTLLRPALLLMRLDRHQGCALDWRSPLGRWHPVRRLVLPGSGQRSLALVTRQARPAGLEGANALPSPNPQPGQQAARLDWPTEGAPNAMAEHEAAAPDTADDQDSRQRGGLGAPTHARMKQGILGVVGLGRTGSALAASATRLGLRVLGLDHDVVEAHNLDAADFMPVHEGWPKARALQKSLGPIARPGAAPDLRVLSADSPAAGALLAHCDLGIVTMVDNLPSLVWVAAWALATLQVHVCVASGLDGEGGLAETEIRVLQPGRGCPLCVGGLAAPLAQVREQIARGDLPGTPADFRQQRPGSVRSVSVTAGHLALRALEQVVQGRLRHSLFRRLRETADGGLVVQDQQVWRAPEACPFCRQFQGAGTAQVKHRALLSALDACIDQQVQPATLPQRDQRPSR